MNFFIPAGYYGSNIGTSRLRVDKGIVELLYGLGGYGTSEGNFGDYDQTLLQRPVPQSVVNEGTLGTFGLLDVPPVVLARTSLLELNVTFCVTRYFLSQFTGTNAFTSSFYLAERRLAVADGMVTLSFFSNSNQLLGFAQSDFQKNAASQLLRFNDFGLDLPVGTQPGYFICKFESSTRLPFGEVQYPQGEIRHNISIVSPNVYVAVKDPFVSRSRSFAVLQIEEPNALIASPLIVADAFADLVLTPATSIGLRGRIDASAVSSGSIRGPIDLASTAVGEATATATQTMIVSLVANGLVAAEMVAIAYIGQTEFLVAGAVAGTTHSASLTVSSRVSGMTLYVNLETRQFVVSPVLLSPVNTIALTRRDLAAIDVQFIRGGRVVELSYGSSGQLGLKDDYSNAPLALDNAWNERGVGTATRYQFSLNLNTAAIDALFTDDDGTASASAKIELEWSEAGTINTTLPATATIFNDVLRGGEGVPLATAASNFQLLASDSSLWTITIDPDGMLTATKS
jgi:hypothetical protein